MRTRNHKTYRILLIEDNPGDIRLIEEALKEGDLPCILNTVYDGESAIKYLNKEYPHELAVLPDIIMLDLNIPRNSGFEVLRQIKSDKRFLHIPVVVLTSSGSNHDINACYRLYANCYIVKPLDLDRFNEVILEIERFWFKVANLPFG